VDEINFDIVPLFESMEAMENSEQIMNSLFEIPEYRKHLSHRNEKQTIMLGFSDGTKDGGYLKANWSIFKAKESLTTVCNKHKIKAIFFDGRGGPPARGGGKTNQFYAAQSEKIANHEIQLTIQGQTITSKYGTKEHFMHHCEQLLTAGLSNKFYSEGNHISRESRKIIDELAQLSFEKYTTLKNHEKFIPYLENKSTLKYYGQTNIGSRPAKRGESEKLELKDLRAISFVGSWSQLKQNVPGYFGIGTAVKTLIDNGKLDDLKNLFNEVPFFKALILNSMMSLSKCYFELTAYFIKDKEYKDFWQILFDEYKLSKEMLLLITCYGELMEESPVSRNSIEIRERIVLPLLAIQQYALQKVEQDSEFKNAYGKIVKRSLYGNINASRNSA
jgi:phosphoenolpyruvate carboxylase